MNLATELSQFDPYKTSPETLAALLVKWAEQAKKEAEKIAALTYELAWHKRLKFAARSEAMSAPQRDLFDDSQAEDLQAIETELEQLTPSAKRTKKKPTGRKPLPAELQRIEYRHEPDSCSYGACGCALVKLGEEITEQLDVEPARFFVRRHSRSQYACRHCETITVAAIPAAVIDGGLAAPGLHAWVVIQQYLDHLPLYRIEQISQRHGAPIARSTLTELIKERSVLHADETPVPQLDPGKGQTKRAYLWVYQSNDLEDDPPIVVFEFQPGRSGSHARTCLSGWQGHRMVDDYAGYKPLFKQGITELACLAHVRRKFFDWHAVASVTSADSPVLSGTEHAVVIHFIYGSKDLTELFTLEQKLEDAITNAGVGEFDGNEVTTDGSDGYLYMYGPDADRLFESIEPILKSTPFMRGAKVTKRYGPPDANSKESIVGI